MWLHDWLELLSITLHETKRQGTTIRYSSNTVKCFQQDVKNTSFSLVTECKRKPNPEKRSITTPRYQIVSEKGEDRSCDSKLLFHFAYPDSFLKFAFIFLVPHAGTCKNVFHRYGKLILCTGNKPYYPSIKRGRNQL